MATMTSRSESDTVIMTLTRADGQRIMESGISVLIVARPGVLRYGLESLLHSIPRIQTIELADDHSVALTGIAEHQPWLVFLDSNLRGDQVEDAVLQIKREWPRTKCLVVVEDVQQAAGAARADAVLLHGTSAEELIATVERLLADRAGEEKEESDSATGH